MLPTTGQRIRTRICDPLDPVCPAGLRLPPVLYHAAGPPMACFHKGKEVSAEKNNARSIATHALLPGDVFPHDRCGQQLERRRPTFEIFVSPS